MVLQHGSSSSRGSSWKEVSWQSTRSTIGRLDTVDNDESNLDLLLGRWGSSRRGVALPTAGYGRPGYGRSVGHTIAQRAGKPLGEERRDLAEVERKLLK